MAPLWLYHGFVVAAAAAALPVRREVVLWLPASQGRINVSAVPAAPRVSFQPPSSHLAYPWFSEWWEEYEQKTIGVTNRISDAQLHGL